MAAVVANLSYLEKLFIVVNCNFIPYKAKSSQVVLFIHTILSKPLRAGNKVIKCYLGEFIINDLSIFLILTNLCLVAKFSLL